MKFFLDTANLDEIRKAAALGLADGVTTNPTLISKEGNVDFKQHIAEICKIVSGPVSNVGTFCQGRRPPRRDPEKPFRTLWSATGDSIGPFGLEQIMAWKVDRAGRRGARRSRPEAARDRVPPSRRRFPD